MYFLSLTSSNMGARGLKYLVEAHSREKRSGSAKAFTLYIQLSSPTPHTCLQMENASSQHFLLYGRGYPPVRSLFIIRFSLFRMKFSVLLYNFNV